MSERGAREIAQGIVQNCPTHYPRADNRGACRRCIDDITAALKEAERERDEATQIADAWKRDVAAAEAQLTRVREALEALIVNAEQLERWAKLQGHARVKAECKLPICVAIRNASAALAEPAAGAST